jgi:all-trans-8'-apo-beta-carotenal 15,15'-oxygenase
MIDRRDFLKLAGTTGATLALLGCAESSAPLPSSVWKPLDDNELPFAGLATSLPMEYDYAPRIEGTLPAALQGTLYRNGPGLFDRGGLRKRMLLDGDGMLQAYQFHNGQVRFRTRFVRTAKYVAEEAAGRFLYRTWSTLAPGGPLANLGLRLANQAEVTVIRRHDRLYAFGGPHPYALDPETLETVGVSTLGVPATLTRYQAHWKVDGHTGEWLHFGVVYRRTPVLHVTVFTPDGHLRTHWTVPLPRQVYMHDWLITARHVVFVLHPGVMTPGGVVSMFLGLRNPADVIRWQPELGNLVLVLDRSGSGAPLVLEADAAWMWHALNAYEERGEIVADFVGAPEIVGLGHPDAPFFAIMRGGPPGPAPPGAHARVRRYVIDPNARTLREDTVAADAGYEMPCLNPRFGCHRHRYGYFAQTGQAEWFWSRVARVDTQTGTVTSYDFGPGHYCSEPVFAPQPGFAYAAGAVAEPGWLLTLVYNAGTKRSYVAILEADRVAAGPVALVHLIHHVPLSFHGYWHAEA